MSSKKYSFSLSVTFPSSSSPEFLGRYKRICEEIDTYHDYCECSEGQIFEIADSHRTGKQMKSGQQPGRSRRKQRPEQGDRPSHTPEPGVSCSYRPPGRGRPSGCSKCDLQ
jgi:hypothetical protein